MHIDLPPNLNSHFMKKFTLLALVIGQVMFAHAQWALTGNAGTSRATDFVGTTDSNALVFRVDNIFSGIIDYSNYNVSLGVLSLSRATSTGQHNTAMGYEALISNTTAGGNTGIGYQSLYDNN